MDENRPDIHEQNLEHENQANKIYLDLSSDASWHRVDCTENGQMKAPLEIHKEIIQLLEV